MVGFIFNLKSLNFFVLRVLLFGDSNGHIQQMGYEMGNP
jgi:hypothetical protein